MCKIQPFARILPKFTFQAKGLNVTVRKRDLASGSDEPKEHGMSLWWSAWM